MRNNLPIPSRKKLPSEGILFLKPEACGTSVHFPPVPTTPVAPPAGTEPLKRAIAFTTERALPAAPSFFQIQDLFAPGRVWQERLRSKEV